MDSLKLIAGLLAVVLVLVLAALFGQDALSAGCVSVLSVQGEISFEGPSLWATTPSARELINKIREWSKSSSPALLLEVNSPGGSAAATKELYDALRSTKKPVVAYLSEVAASGGYYVAAASKHIVANPNTLTGSIGARAELLNYEELFKKMGLRQESIQTGKFKDIGAGYRNLTEEERRILNDVIQETYENFRKDVEESRKGKLTQAYSKVLDARILTAKQALAAGLVDEIGSREQALKKAGELGNLGDEPSECQLIEENPLEKVLQKLSAGFASVLVKLSRAQSVRLAYS